MAMDGQALDVVDKEHKAISVYVMNSARSQNKAALKDLRAINKFKRKKIEWYLGKWQIKLICVL